MKVFATTQHLKSFALEVNLKGGHVALGLISKSFLFILFKVLKYYTACYMGYQTFEAYRNYNNTLDIFEKYKKEINKTPLQKNHQLAYKTAPALSGYPDDGNPWHYSWFYTFKRDMALVKYSRTGRLDQAEPEKSQIWRIV